MKEYEKTEINDRRQISTKTEMRRKNSVVATKK
jgi:hypothetical protein